MNVIIGQVAEHNVDDLLRMLGELAAYERMTGPDEAGRRRLREDVLGANPRFEAYLAMADGQAVGYFTFYEAYSTFLALPTLFLEDIFVVETHRRHGVGQQLFDFCVSIARERGCGRMEWQVLDWNEPAIRFYEKNHARLLDPWGWWVLDPR